MPHDDDVVVVVGAEHTVEGQRFTARECDGAVSVDRCCRPGAGFGGRGRRDEVVAVNENRHQTPNPYTETRPPKVPVAGYIVNPS